MIDFQIPGASAPFAAATIAYQYRRANTVCERPAFDSSFRITVLGRGDADELGRPAYIDRLSCADEHFEFGRPVGEHVAPLCDKQTPADQMFFLRVGRLAPAPTPKASSVAFAKIFERWGPHLAQASPRRACRQSHYPQRNTLYRNG